MEKNKNKWLIYLCIAIFGIVGLYLTFISSNTREYDSQVKAYKIDPNESYDSDNGTTYYPVYYFKVDGAEYECKAKTGSSAYPSEDKNTVYYHSENPTKCKTEYEKSTSYIAGIICLIVTGIILYFFTNKKPSDDLKETHKNKYEESQTPIDQEKVDKIIGMVNKVQLIYKRVIIGIIIVILLVFIIIDTMLFKQTIKSKDFIETIATYIRTDEKEENDLFCEYIYVFKDKVGKEYEVVKSYSKDDTVLPEEEITVKYNKNNPEDYYEEGSTLDKKGMIWYLVKVVALILLIILFFNKKLLNKISISITPENINNNADSI